MTWQQAPTRLTLALRCAGAPCGCGMGTRVAVDEEDAGKLLLGPGACAGVYGRRRCADAPSADFKTYPEPRKSAKGMMLAEVKLLMEDKISGDREKGEETPTTKTKCVPRWAHAHAAFGRRQPPEELWRAWRGVAQRTFSCGRL